MADEIETLIDDFLREKYRCHPLERTAAIVESSPTTATLLAVAIIERLPDSVAFLGLACDFMPMEDWPTVVAAALDAVEDGAEDSPADQAIAYASMQCPQALHPHLDRIFRIRPAEESFAEPWPWRDSGTAHLPALQAVVSDASATKADRSRAWHAMLETRTPEAFRFAIRTYDDVRPHTHYGLNSRDTFL